MATEALGVRKAVLAKALRAYTLARRRGAMQKSAAGREEVKALAREFPESYSLGGPEKNLTFTGQTADSVLEDYLQGLGEPRYSKLWSELAGIVIARGERVEREIKALAGGGA
jgi:hypothetical protein